MNRGNKIIGLIRCSLKSYRSVDRIFAPSTRFYQNGKGKSSSSLHQSIPNPTTAPFTIADSIFEMYSPWTHIKCTFADPMCMKRLIWLPINIYAFHSITHQLANLDLKGFDVFRTLCMVGLDTGAYMLWEIHTHTVGGRYGIARMLWTLMQLEESERGVCIAEMWEDFRWTKFEDERLEEDRWRDERITKEVKGRGMFEKRL
ncbi:hypothetical protein DL98DRAFT_61017 [Cadophora sp. DSE1049]|nr:hypothetical protein DL98DRAFT_61017 [Cadophora sp. DSE1049]